MDEKHIFLISFLFGISMVTSQSIINGDWNINACELYYNRANPLEPGEFWYERLCYSKSPCDWCGGPDDIIQTSLKYGSKAGTFNLTDNSYFDLTIRILNYTYQYWYTLSKIEFAWGPDEFSKCNETTSYIEILPNRQNFILSNPDDWLRINFSQSYNSPVTLTTIDSPFQLSQYPVVYIHLHFEWNEITSNGLIQPAYLRFEGTGGTWNPSPEPTHNPTVVTFSPSQILPSVNPTLPTIYPSKNPTTTPTETPSKFPTIFPSKNPTTTPTKTQTQTPTFVTTNPTYSPTKGPTYAFCADDTNNKKTRRGFVSNFDDPENICEFCVCEENDLDKEVICEFIETQAKDNQYMQDQFMEFCDLDSGCSFEQIVLKKEVRSTTKK
eukprot:788617_1